jgi:uncharacterized membrane protein HdeD (DUF308 family)
MTSTRTQSGPISPLALLHELADNWWLVLLRGIAAIAFGILAFFWPGIALVTLVYLWGTYAIVDGVLALAAAIAGMGGEIVPRWWLVLVGIAGILAGVLAFVWPDITAQVLLALIAAWAIMIGVLQIVGAIQLRKEIEGEWLLGLSGLLWILFGVALVAQPSPARVRSRWSG